MNDHRSNKSLNALLAASAALVCATIALVLFSWAPLPAAAGPRRPAADGLSAGDVITWTSGIPPTATPPRPIDGTERWLYVNPAAPNDDLPMVLSAPTEIDNGDVITYELLVTNRSGAARSNILIIDVLPKDEDGKYILSKVSCSDNCGRVYQTEVIREPLGSTVTVTITRQISWNISLNNNQAQTLYFWGPVVGQNDGTTFENLAYGYHDDIGAATSNEVQTTIRVRPTTPGYASLSAAPTWLSADLGGTLGMDWGDFDRDGDLDLAVGSTVGTFVYENRGGRLKGFWQNDTYALGVRWADLDDDGQLELVSVGETTNGKPTGASPVRFYDQSGTTFQQTHVITAPEQLVRVEPGDFDNDNDIDLVVTTNSINAWCPVRIYHNHGGTTTFRPDRYACISDNKAAANISPVDYDHDGDLDLVTGEFPNKVRLWINDNSTPPHSPTPPFGSSVFLLPNLSFLPYDFSWGDYDNDGDLDLAAAFPLERRARLYTNVGGDLQFEKDFRTTLFRTPLSVEWGDFDGDGTLDLAIAGAPPEIILNKDGRFGVTEMLETSFVQGQIWALAAADADVDGDLDLMIGNRDGPNLLFTTFSPFLSSTLSIVDSKDASDVAWGDIDADGTNDLLFASGEIAGDDAWIYAGTGTDFVQTDRLDLSGVGPRKVALADIDSDDDLDFALSTIAGVEVRTNEGGWRWTESNLDVSGGTVRGLAWGDAESDSDLDLFVARDGTNALYLNQGGAIEATPHWTSEENENTVGVAWGDYDEDLHLDVAAAATQGGRVRVYRNNHDQTFTSAWQSTGSYSARCVAWGDADGDGDLDLAVGVYGFNVIFENVDGTLGTVPVWVSTEGYNTTSIAWGDWDNDGDLDLAVGNYGQADQVYDNAGGFSLEWRWTSDETQNTTGVAWGDQDGDGDLDLAVSTAGNASVGVYENTYAYPAHLHGGVGPLPNNPAYLSIKRPGDTATAYHYSTQEILGKPAYPTVTVEYTVYDAENDDIVGTVFQYSLNGGGTWQQATPAIAPVLVTQALSTGRDAVFYWDAQADAAIGDNALFRISITHSNPIGPVFEQSSSSASPPFRLEGTACAWPEDPQINYTPSDPASGEPVQFLGSIRPGTGSQQVTFTWDFGDGSDPVNGQNVQHTYTYGGTYQVRLTVTSAPCPMQKSLSVIRTVTIGGGERIYLPLVLKNHSD